MSSVFLADLAATYRFAASFAENIQPGQVVYLYGALGAGKTSLVQGFLTAWQCQETVTSPTFTLVEPYRLPNFLVYHFDFYRIENPHELEVIGIREYFTHQSICFIEWPEIAQGHIPPANWKIYLRYDQQGRSITIFPSTSKKLIF